MSNTIEVRGQKLQAATFAVAVLAATGCGVIAGLLFAFSDVVMTSLAHQPAAAAILTMQAINVDILNPLFILAFLGTALACLALIVVTWRKRSAPGVTLLLAGAGLYLVGVIGVTMVFNVPMNDHLAVLDANSAEAGTYWREYLSRWMMWNHVRTGAGVLALATLAWGLGRGAREPISRAAGRATPE